MMSFKKNSLNEDEFNDIRYFRVNKDITLDLIPLQKGDIVRIPNSYISNHILYDFFPGQNMNDIIGEYPKNQLASPQQIIEFLKTKQIHFDKYPDPIYLKFGSSHGIYLNTDLAQRIFTDNSHDVELDIYASTHGANYLFPGIPDSLAVEKFGEALSATDGLSFPMELGDYNRMRVLNRSGSIKLISLLDGTNSLSTIIDNNNTTELALNKSRIVPGIYNTDKEVMVKFYMNPDETIDFSKQPEFLYNFTNQFFLEFLENSTEITRAEDKQEIYKDLNRDIIVSLDGTNKIRYYRLKPGISIKANPFYEFNNSDLIKAYYLSEIGINDFNIDRVVGEVQLVEIAFNDESGILKVIVDDYYSDITDKELSKIAERLSGAELHITRIKDIQAHKAKKLQELRNRYWFNKNSSSTSSKSKKDISNKSLDPLDRKIKLIDLAAMRVKKSNLSDDFKKKAYEYYEKNTIGKNGKYHTSKSLQLFEDIYLIVSGNIDLDEFYDYVSFQINICHSEDFIFTFYMVHLIEKSLNNPTLNNEHTFLQQNKQRQFVNVLNGILQKREEEEEEK